MDVQGIVFDITRYAIHDGPGIRSTVFFKGCPLSCPWCHNPESRAAMPELCLTPQRCVNCGACVQACPHGAIAPHEEVLNTDTGKCARCGTCVEACPSGARRMAGHEMSVAEVLAEVEKDRIFYDESHGGVTFSGGEPLMQADFLRACLEACRQRGYHTTLDTCGYARIETVLSVAATTNLVLYDLKLMDDARHRQYAGVSNAPILDNLRALDARGHALWIRVPLIPGINDDDDNLSATAAFVQSLRTRPPLHLLPYHRAGSDKYQRFGKRYTMAGTPPHTRERLAEIAGRLAALGLDVKVGG